MLLHARVHPWRPLLWVGVHHVMLLRLLRLVLARLLQTCQQCRAQRVHVVVVIALCCGWVRATLARSLLHLCHKCC